MQPERQKKMTENLKIPVQGEIKAPRMETITTTAEILHVPVHFVRTKVKNGEVVAVKAGRRYLVNVDKFIEYLNSNTVDPDPKMPCAARIEPIRFR